MAAERARMVATQLEARGISDVRVLAAFRQVPREAFVPVDLREQAYRDAPLPIGHGQTISQPYIVALTVEALALRDGDRVLEVGTGSGYAAAVLAELAAEVFTIERLPALAQAARTRLERLGYHGVTVLAGDGTLGCPAHAPFDAIAVAAAGPEIPVALTQQLALGGRLVIPVGGDDSAQVLVKVTRASASELIEEPLGDVRFVPLVGQQGWPGPDPRDS